MISPSISYLLSRLLCSPSEILFTLLIFILSKNFNATALQLTVLASLKPITSLISYYISTILHGKSNYIRPYLIVNTLAGAISSFLYPFTDNVWFYIASYALFMITKRAQEPAWIEFLRGHHQLKNMSKTVSHGMSLSYFMSMTLPPILALWLDDNIWKIFYVALKFKLLVEHFEEKKTIKK